MSGGHLPRGARLQGDIVLSNLMSYNFSPVGRAERKVNVRWTFTARSQTAAVNSAKLGKSDNECPVGGIGRRASFRD